MGHGAVPETFRFKHQTVHELPVRDDGKGLSHPPYSASLIATTRLTFLFTISGLGGVARYFRVLPVRTRRVPGYGLGRFPNPGTVYGPCVTV